jgi:hypothetical protein
MLRDGPVKGARSRAAAGAREVPDRWHQDAGFSVFFESRSGLPGELRSRTRLYHEESAQETIVVGSDPTAWVSWMLDRVGSATPLSGPVQDALASLVSLEIIDARMLGEPNGVSDDSVRVELRLRVTGLDELHRAVGARVVGVLFGPDPE